MYLIEIKFEDVIIPVRLIIKPCRCVEDFACSRGELLSLSLRPLYPEERTSGIHWIEDWIGRRSGLDKVANTKIIAQVGNRNPIFQPAASHS